MNKINILITGEAKGFLNEVLYTFSEISVRLGIKIQVFLKKEKKVTFDLVYGSQNFLAESLFIRIDPNCYTNQKKVFLNDKHGFWIGKNNLDKKCLISSAASLGCYLLVTKFSFLQSNVIAWEYSRSMHFKRVEKVLLIFLLWRIMLMQ